MQRGRKGYGDRAYLQAIIFGLIINTSWIKVAKKLRLPDRKLNDIFIRWYKQGIFADLLQLVSVCPELQAIEPQLIEMERIRQEKGTVPRIKDLQIKNNPSN